MTEVYQSSTTRKLTTAVITLVVIAGLVMVADHLKTKSDLSTSTHIAKIIANTPAVTPSTNDTTSSSSSYKDGSYSANESYFVPPGQESIQVSLTLTNGVVTDASIANSQNDRESAIFQQDFANSYKNQVVGKSISTLEISTISGASDTTRAFNDALSRIRSQAGA